MKKITFCIVLFALLLLSSCANLFSPPYDPRLEGTWEGSTKITTREEQEETLLDITYTVVVVTTEATTEKYTFYNGNEVKRERSWSKEVSTDGLPMYAWGNGTSTWEWKNLRDNYDIDLSNIDTGKITIDGFELTKQP